MQPTLETVKAAHSRYNPQDLPFSVFVARIRNLGWSVEKAGATPYTPRSKRLVQYKHLFDRIEAPVVSFDTFCSRLRQDKAPEEAATTPLPVPAQLRAYYDAHPAPEVSYQRFYSRVQFKNWDKAKAISTPLVRVVKSSNRQPKTYLAQWYNKNKDRAKVHWDRFSHRVNKLGWEREKALVTPTQCSDKQALRLFYNAHPKPRVGYTTFYNRVKVWGWSKDTAISEPPRSARTMIPVAQRPKL